MLEWIGNLINTIVTGVTNLVNGVATMVEYVVSIVKDTAWIVNYIGSLAAGGIRTWFEWLPSVCSSVIIGCIAIAVVYKILGRE